MLVTRTYLELTAPDAFRPAFGVFPGLVIAAEPGATPALYRDLYRAVGAAYHWRDRWDWTDEQLAAHLAEPGVTLFVARERGVPAGFYELKREADGSVEIAYFGLLPDFVGRGYGKHLLSQAVRDAWAMGARRVWLHTCTLDHPSALPNYLGRGFREFKKEQYET